MFIIHWKNISGGVLSTFCSSLYWDRSHYPLSNSMTSVPYNCITPPFINLYIFRKCLITCILVPEQHKLSFEGVTALVLDRRIDKIALRSSKLLPIFNNKNLNSETTRIVLKEGMNQAQPDCLVSKRKPGVRKLHKNCLILLNTEVSWWELKWFNTKVLLTIWVKNKTKPLCQWSKGYCEDCRTIPVLWGSRKEQLN